MIQFYPELNLCRISRRIYNCYILNYNNDLPPIIIDAGIRSQTNFILQVLHQFKKKTGRLTCTHFHVDHISGMPSLYRKYPHPLEVLFHKQVYQYTQGKVQPFPPSIKLLYVALSVWAEQEPADKSKWDFVVDTLSGFVHLFGGVPYIIPKCPFPVEYWWNTSGPIPETEGWEVLFTPGHSEDSLCFYHPKKEALISGDTLLTTRNRAWFNPYHADTKAMRQTEQFLRNVPISILFPGHGPVLEGEHLTQKAYSAFEKIPGQSRYILRCLLPSFLGKSISL